MTPEIKVVILTGTWTQSGNYNEFGVRDYKLVNQGYIIDGVQYYGKYEDRNDTQTDIL